MSCSAYARVILGVEVKVVRTKVEKEATRYDVKTGRPYQNKYTTHDVAIAIAENTIRLPDDEEAPEHAHPSDSRLYERSLIRVRDFFDSRRFAEVGSRAAEQGALCAWYRRDRCFVGRELATACDDGYPPDDEFARDFVLPSESATDGIYEEIRHRLGLDSVPYPRLYLVASLSC